MGLKPDPFWDMSSLHRDQDSAADGRIRDGRSVLWIVKFSHSFASGNLLGLGLESKIPARSRAPTGEGPAGAGAGAAWELQHTQGSSSSSGTGRARASKLRCWARSYFNILFFLKK